MAAMSNTGEDAVPRGEDMIAMCRNHPERAAQVFNQWLEEGNIETLLATLREIATACGISETGEDVGLSGQDACEDFRMLMGIAEVIGARLVFVQKNPS